MRASEFKAKYIRPEFVNRFCVISCHNDRQWITLENDQEIPKHMMVGIRMKADLGAWLSYEQETGNTEGP